MTPDEFIYQQFQVDDDHRTVNFSYRVQHDGETYDFVETLEFPLQLRDTPTQQASLRALHLALGISYYKIFLPAAIRHPYEMDTAETIFWNDIWQNGLAEFMYVNNLSGDRLAKFSEQNGTNFPVTTLDELTSDKVLLGIGGGKDSIVAGEVLKKSDVPLESFNMATGEQLGQAKAVAETMGIPLHAVKRVIDKQLLIVQEQPGTYKGHIPISLIFGLVGTALAISNDCAYVVVANEASASLPRTQWGDIAVNHQWSKSFGFEKKLQEYIKTDISPRLTYFSAIRQLTSVGVAKIFSHFPEYFEVFTSDNFVFRIDPSRRPNGRWSLESPKSLSSFILLAPWISESDMLKIFGRNFLNESTLEQLFLRLTGVEGNPPLDCVGTVDELVVSMNLIASQGKFSDSYIMNLARNRKVIIDKDWQTEVNDMLLLQSEQALPEVLADTITTTLQSELNI